MSITTIDYLSQLEKIVETQMGEEAAKTYPIKLTNRHSKLGLMDNPLIDTTDIILPSKITKFASDKKNVMNLNLLTHFLSFQQNRFQEATGMIKIVDGLQITSFFDGMFYKKLLEIGDMQQKMGKSKANHNPKLLIDVFDTLNTYSILKQLFKENKGLESHYQKSETPKAFVEKTKLRFKTGLDRYMENFRRVLYYDYDIKGFEKSYRTLLEECTSLVEPVSLGPLKGLVKPSEQIYEIVRDNFHITKYMSPKKRLNLFAMKSLKMAKKTRQIEKAKMKDKEMNEIFGFEPGRSVVDLLQEDDIIAINRVKDAMSQLFLKKKYNALDEYGEIIDMEEWMDGEMEFEATGVRNSNDIFAQEDDPVSSVAAAILADVSPSMESYKIFKPLKRAMVVYTRAIDNWNTLDPKQKISMGHYAFAGRAYEIEGFDQDITQETYEKIATLRTGSSTCMDKGLKLVYDEINAVNAKKKLVTIITDGETGNVKQTKEWLQFYKDKKIYPVLIVLGKHLEPMAQELMGKGKGEDKPYSIVERDEIYKLGDELLRIFNKYGLSLW